ncbi:MAG: hypothetical protein J0M34_00005, partial [Alphaproteobacteria bacterium]|nr:hypothetical protein [Alphaproteobacteria bacterium]
MSRKRLYVLISVAAILLVYYLISTAATNQIRLSLKQTCIEDAKRNHQFDTALSDDAPAAFSYCLCIYDGIHFTTSEVAALFFLHEIPKGLDVYGLKRRQACMQWMGNMGRPIPIATAPTSAEGKQHVEICMLSVEKSQKTDKQLFMFENYEHLSRNMCNCVADDTLFSPEEHISIANDRATSETKQKMQYQVKECFRSYGGLHWIDDVV